MVRTFSPAAARQHLTLARRALGAWSPRQFIVAALVAVACALLVGVATVLIPNPWFARDIDTVWWNYPAWILTAIGAGMLTATYVTPPAGRGAGVGDDGEAEAGAEAGTDAGVEAGTDAGTDAEARRTTRMGIAGGVLTWFAVGCPVCNKIALLALGYSGAITWFAPLQPVLAIVALVLTGLALVWRLSGQVACQLPGAGRDTRRAATAELESVQ